MVAACAGRRIADALQMQCVFLCEFEEVHSPLRDARSQVFSYSQRHTVVSAVRTHI